MAAFAPALPFADMLDDLDFAPVAEVKPAGSAHPFAHLGRFPYRCLGAFDRGEKSGTCSHCGTAIRYEFEIADADGKLFRVGSDCVKRTNADVIGFSNFEHRMRKLKAVATAQATARNRAARADKWFAEHPLENKFLQDAQAWSNFYRSLLDQAAGGKILSEPQLQSIHRGMYQQAERKMVKEWERDQVAAKINAAPTIDTTAIHAVFDALAAKGLKYPKITLGQLTISPAGANSRNPGALYIKRGRGYAGTYLGKIVAGRFTPSSECTEDEGKTIAELVADPKGKAKAYGIETGVCCVCNRELTDPVSIANGIGPICAAGW